MPAKPVVINDIYEDLWRQFTKHCKANGNNIGDGLAEALRIWLRASNIRATDARTVTVCLRGMDEDLWRTFKAGAILSGLTIAEGVEEALIQYFKLQVPTVITPTSLTTATTGNTTATEENTIVKR